MRSGPDGVEGNEGRRLFNLGDDAGAAGNNSAGVAHVLGPLHEGQRHPIDAKFKREVKILAVLVGHRRHRQHHMRHVDALAVRKLAANLDLGLHVIAAMT